LFAAWVERAAARLQVGQRLHLTSLVKRAPQFLATGDNIQGAVIIDETATVGSGCLIGPDVSIGPQCVIGDGVRLANCVIMKGCVVRPPGRGAFACRGSARGVLDPPPPPSPFPPACVASRPARVVACALVAATRAAAASD
jgi:hypothetical protein